MNNFIKCTYVCIFFVLCISCTAKKNDDITSLYKKSLYFVYGLNSVVFDREVQCINYALESKAVSSCNPEVLREFSALFDDIALNYIYKLPPDQFRDNFLHSVYTMKFESNSRIEVLANIKAKKLIDKKVEIDSFLKEMKSKQEEHCDNLNMYSLYESKNVDLSKETPLIDFLCELNSIVRVKTKNDYNLREEFISAWQNEYDDFESFIKIIESKFPQMRIVSD